ncbi:MAG: diguanylate cyclase [Desulfobacteraceae bacterium]|nr:MAG: diguanylate cyclase [Desulfobacteraceae bacterium]
MDLNDCFKDFPGALTVSDRGGIILYMNDASAKVNEKQGGLKLIGKNVLDCHPEPARAKLNNLMETQEKNVYTIEKQGKKKIVYQTPWYVAGVYQGFMELTFEIPLEMPHFVRQG